MNYETIVNKMKEYYSSVCTDSVKGHLAVQFNVTGDGYGIFYLEHTDNLLKVEPYDYYDHDLCITANSSIFLRIAEHTLTFEQASESGLCSVIGHRIDEFFSILPITCTEKVPDFKPETANTNQIIETIIPAPETSMKTFSDGTASEIKQSSSTATSAPKKQKKLSRKKRKAEKLKNKQ